MKVYSISAAPCYKQNFQSVKQKSHIDDVTMEMRRLAMTADDLFKYLDRNRIIFAHTNANGDLDITRTKSHLGYIGSDSFVLTKKSDDKDISVVISKYSNCGTVVSLSVGEVRSGRLDKVVYQFNSDLSNIFRSDNVFSEGLSAYSRASYSSDTYQHSVRKKDKDLFEKYVGEIINDAGNIQSRF